MKRLELPGWASTALFVIALLVPAFVYRRQLLTWFTGKPSSESTARTPSHTAPAGSIGEHAGEIDHYTCSMHPSVRQQSPGKCPICGMELIPVTKAQHQDGVVLIDEKRRQLIGVRTASVVEAPMQRSFRAVGRVTYDESAITDVTLKVSGFITKLYVSQTGQRVRKGQPLFLLYSPELYSAQQDFLLANQGASFGNVASGGGTNRMEMLGKASRQRLHLLGLSEAQIDEVAKKAVPLESISFAAPASGFVIEKDVVEGASVQAGMRLYRIAALNQVWVEAEVYEADLALVRVGQKASVTLDYLPGRSYDAKVSYIYPYLNGEARTGRVRVELANKELELRPGMYASVNLASQATTRVQVPSAAVVYTGPRRLVFVDLGEGRFRPQEVSVGSEADGMYEVLSGLSPGDRVAVSGVFLIAAEARISTAAKYWDKAPAEAPSSKPSPSSAAPVRPAATIYTCPMHPEVRTHAPGKCPKCGMDLQPAHDGDHQ
jgi:Cu(I)/Ag(I) efflux system membrane fusion protein